MSTGTVRKAKGKVAALLILLFVSLAIATIPRSSAALNYTFYGCFSEWGIAESDFKSCLIFRQGEAPYRFDINGTFVRTWDGGTPTYHAVPWVFSAATKTISFSVDLGYNVSRVYYTLNGAEESIYVIVPYSSELWNPYTFYVVDYVGLEWGYLELTLPINGTERVLERWDVKTMSNINLIMVWGKTYNLRLQCNLGTYQYPTFTAGTTQTTTLAITQEMFFQAPVTLEGIYANVTRQVDNKIKFEYDNAYEDTVSVDFKLYEYGNSTPIWTDHYAYTDTIVSYYNLAEPKDYYAKIIYNSSSAGSGVRTFSIPYIPIDPTDYSSHPFAVLRDFGNLPFDPANIPAIAILLIIAFVISWYHLEWGIILEVLVTVGLVYIRWLAISWSWIGVVASIGMLLAFSERRTREIG